MKKRLLLTAMSATLSLGILGACGAGNNNLNDGDGTDYRPVRYDRQDDGMFDNRNTRNGVNPVRYDNDMNNRGNRDNDGLFDMNNNRNNDGLFDGNTDLFDNDNNNRGNNRTTGTNQGNGTMGGRTTGQ